MWFKVGLCSLGTSRKMFHCEIGELLMWYKGTLIKLKPQIHPNFSLTTTSPPMSS